MIKNLNYIKGVKRHLFKMLKGDYALSKMKTTVGETKKQYISETLLVEYKVYIIFKADKKYSSLNVYTRSEDNYDEQLMRNIAKKCNLTERDLSKIAPSNHPEKLATEIIDALTSYISRRSRIWREMRNMQEVIHYSVQCIADHLNP